MLQILFPTGEDALPTLTPEQVESITHLVARKNLGPVITIEPLIGGDGCVITQVGSYWCGIEKNGYCHT